MHNASQAPREAAAPVAGPSVNVTVNFPTGSAELTPSTKASLDALGKALASSDLASFRFRIEGHTDNVGSRDANLALSQQRAEAVVSYLTSQYNVAPSRLEAVGMGQERPLVDTPPQTPEARNRRVQVINLGA
jgi:outer membrane protein OmpA-like peptidoglycan-associated protein